MRFPLSSPDSVSKAAIDAAIACLESGQHTMGKRVADFERQFARYVGSKHAVMVNSGSSANLLAVEALRRPSNNQPRWAAGDEILVPALAWSTSVWPLIQAGLTPVFVDVDPATMEMDPSWAMTKVTARTRGILLIHVLGVPASMSAWEAFASDYRLTLVEDCCEAFGARWKGRSVGTFGVLGTFSHFFSHQLPTVEGGMIVTDEDAIADDLRSMRAHGWSRQRSDRAEWEARCNIDPRFLFVTSGYNVRPMELQGAMGSIQLEDAEAVRLKHVETACAIKAVCDRAGWIEMLGWAKGPYRQWSWMNAPLLVKNERKDRLVRTLESMGVETRPIIAGNITRHPAFVGYRTACPVADRIMAWGFMIGCYDPQIAEALEGALKACAVAA